MGIPLINGLAYDFSQLTPVFLGAPLPSMSAINYEETQEKVNNFGIFGDFKFLEIVRKIWHNFRKFRYIFAFSLTSLAKFRQHFIKIECKHGNIYGKQFWKTLNFGNSIFILKSRTTCLL